MPVNKDKPLKEQLLPHPSHDARDAVEASDSPLKKSGEQLELLKRNNKIFRQIEQPDTEKKSS